MFLLYIFSLCFRYLYSLFLSLSLYSIQLLFCLSSPFSLSSFPLCLPFSLISSFLYLPLLYPHNLFFSSSLLFSFTSLLPSVYFLPLSPSCPFSFMIFSISSFCLLIISLSLLPLFCLLFVSLSLSFLFLILPLFLFILLSHLM
jgi:hypothetical protein